MPVLESSTYRPPPLLANGHLQTLYPVLFRRVALPSRTRERIRTPDDDFLDLDWTRRNRDRLAILTHGLEGHSSRQYMLGMTRALDSANWDVLAWNCRGCSGEPNRQLRFYHSGATEDLETVIQHVLRNAPYPRIALIGYSLGGNMTLKYLGERRGALHPVLSRAATFSVPCDLAAGALEMARPANRIYMISFLRSLRRKIRAKARLMPGRIDDHGYHRIRTFRHFDGRYTAPLHGFKSAEDYWERCSSKSFIPHISIPTLLVNAQNDPFLAGECYPVRQAKNNPDFVLEMPASGGHVGFVSFNPANQYWSETRALQFLETV